MDRVPPKKRPRSGDGVDARKPPLLAPEDGAASDVDDDVDPDPSNGLSAIFDLRARAHKINESVEWVKKAKQRSFALLTGDTNAVLWWSTQKAGLFPLPHLPFSQRTGVHEFQVNAGVCSALHDYLEDRSNRDADGHLFVDGDSWPGYAAYDLLHR